MLRYLYILIILILDIVLLVQKDIFMTKQLALALLNNKLTALAHQAIIMINKHKNVNNVQVIAKCAQILSKYYFSK